MPETIEKPRAAVLTLAQRSHRELLRGLEAAHARDDTDGILRARRRLLAHFDLVAGVRDAARIEAVQHRDRYHAVRSDLSLMIDARDQLRVRVARQNAMLEYLERRLKANGRALWRLIGFGDQNSLFAAITDREPTLFSDTVLVDA